MVSSGTGADEAWGKLGDASDAEREDRILSRYKELAGLGEEERRAQLRPLMEAEYALPDDKLRAFTVSRMRVWLRLGQEEARTVSASYDGVMQQMSAPVAMRRVGMVQTLVMSFSAEDEARLRDLLPAVFAGAPKRPLPQEARPVAPAPTAAPAARKPWWAFWKKA